MACSDRQKRTVGVAAISHIATLHANMPAEERTVARIPFPIEERMEATVYAEESIRTATAKARANTGTMANWKGTQIKLRAVAKSTCGTLHGIHLHRATVMIVVVMGIGKRPPMAPRAMATKSSYGVSCLMGCTKPLLRKDTDLLFTE